MDELLTFKGKEIQMEGWAHLSNQDPATGMLGNAPAYGLDAYNSWLNIQNQLYAISEKNILSFFSIISDELNHPLSRAEMNSIILAVEKHSLVPILSAVDKYYSAKNTSKDTSKSSLLYLGAGNDFEHASVFLPHTSVFVDYNNYYDNVSSKVTSYFKKFGYSSKVENRKSHEHLSLERDGLEKEFIFIKENMKNHEAIKRLLSDNGINSLDFLIQKKASGHPECALNYFNNLKESGLFLYSDLAVYKDIPGFKQTWYGELNSKRLQDGGDIEPYPAKLFQKEQQ